MKERPILFNGEMVRAILDGRKTQTRRVVKNVMDSDDLTGARAEVRANYHFLRLPNGDEYGPVKCPYGLPGDSLWVRETWASHLLLDGERPSEFTEAQQECQLWFRAEPKIHEHGQGRWRPSIFMPRWASRITLKVTDVRVERVQDISEEDARAEGVAPLFDHKAIHEPRYRAELDLDPMPFCNYLWHGHIGRSITAKQSDAWDYQYSSYKSARDSFSSLWDSINAKRGYGWDTNPWCWVVEFERVQS